MAMIIDREWALLFMVMLLLIVNTVDKSCYDIITRD